MVKSVDVIFVCDCYRVVSVTISCIVITAGD